jgi:hypothetical protein
MRWMMFCKNCKESVEIKEIYFDIDGGISLYCPKCGSFRFMKNFNVQLPQADAPQPNKKQANFQGEVVGEELRWTQSDMDEVQAEADKWSRLYHKELKKRKELESRLRAKAGA